MTEKELRNIVRKAFTDGACLAVKFVKLRGAPATPKDERILEKAMRAVAENEYWRTIFEPTLKRYTLTATRRPRAQKEKGEARQSSAKKKR